MVTTLTVRKGMQNDFNTFNTSTGLANGELALTTDTRRVYVGNGTPGGATLVGKVYIDFAANRTSISEPPDGLIFLAKDTGVISIYNGVDEVWIDLLSNGYIDDSGNVTALYNSATDEAAVINDAAAAGTSVLWTSDKIQTLISSGQGGLNWQDIVISRVTDEDDIVAPPIGARYIIPELAEEQVDAFTNDTVTINSLDLTGAINIGDHIRIRQTNNASLDDPGNNGEYIVSNISFSTDTVITLTTNLPSLSEIPTDLYVVYADDTANADWVQLGAPGDIVEWNGSAWVNITAGLDQPNVQWATGVTDEGLSCVFTYDGKWVSLLGISAHNSLMNLQGGTASEYFHLTNIQHGVISEIGDATVPGNSTGDYVLSYNSNTQTYSWANLLDGGSF